MKADRKPVSKPWRSNMKKASMEKLPEPPEPEEKKVDENEERPWRKNMKKLEDHIPGKTS